LKRAAASSAGARASGVPAEQAHALQAWGRSVEARQRRGNQAADRRVGARLETYMVKMEAFAERMEGCRQQHPVLVVEDDADIRECVKMILELGGFRVVTAANGAEAEQELEHLGPCVMLLDLMMPVMSGWELLAHLRDKGTLDKGLHVVVVSASPPTGLDGTVDVVKKPVKLDKLIETVRRWC
jgi:CheY-like chemotaxis protein